MSDSVSRTCAGGRFRAWSWRLLAVAPAVVFVAVVVGANVPTAPSPAHPGATPDVAHALEHALAPDLEALVVAADLMERGDVHDWREFQRRLGAAGRASGRVIGWAPRIGGSDRARFEDDSGRSAPRSFRVLELDEGRAARPAGERDVYFPVTFFDQRTTPAHGLQLGLDLASLPGLRTLYGGAQVPATGHLVRWGGGPTRADAGDTILAVLPVFAAPSPGRRHAPLLGLVFTLGPTIRLADR